MGSCVSVHKDPESALKLRFSVETKDDSVLIPSPVKEAVNGGDRTVGDVALKPQSSPAPRFVDAGSKDEGFFDSQPWLESDCEDDFFSVNGDFTPSRGNTPVHHHSFSSANQRSTNARAVESTAGPIPEPSPPPDKKKRLSELFKESLRGNNDYIDEDPSKVAAESTVLIQRPKSTSGTPYLSGANSRTSSERTPDGGPGDEDGSLKARQCCLPRLILNRSFSERKKKTSPARKVG